MNKVKIGDFGLATTGQFAADKTASSGLDSNDMTRSIGTSFYVAPEVRRGGIGSYTSKVDVSDFTTTTLLFGTDLSRCTLLE
jgi:eukaryotic translation initiation factor 2-alpha kinase 4